MRLHWLLALLVYCAIAVSLTGPALVGLSSIIPEPFLDADILYRHADRSKLRPFEDLAPVVLELGRELAVAEGLKQGRLDTWNPWSGAGAPLWAEHGSPFFPTKFIYYLYPHHATFMLALAMRLVVAALGMFFLARALGLSPPVALVTGALFEYSGILSATLAYSNTSAAYVLPWALLGAHKLWTERGPAAVAVSGLALGLALHGGHPSFNLLVCLGFGAWLLGEGARRRPSVSELARVMVLTLAACALAFLVAAVALLPFIELMWHGYTYKNSEVAELIWRERRGWTWGVFAPALLLPSLITATRDTIGYHGWPWAEGASIGLTALLLAVAGARRLRENWGLILLAILGVGLTLSPPGLQWLHQLPGIRVILPWYCYPLIVVPLCVAAGFGLQMIADAPRRNLLVLHLGVLLSGSVLLWSVLVAIVFLNSPEFTISFFWWIRITAELLNLDFTHIQDWKTYVSPAAAVVAVAAYLLLCRRNVARAAALVAALAMIEAAIVRIPTIHFERAVVLRSGPSDATARLHGLLSDRFWRFTTVPPLGVATPNSNLLFGLRDLRSFSALAVRRHVKFLELAGSPAEDPWKRPQWQYPPHMRLPILSLAAVKYVVYAERHAETISLFVFRPTQDREVARAFTERRYRKHADTSPGLKVQETLGEVVFFENLYAFPRFRIAHDVIPVESEQQAFESLQRMVEDASPDAQWSRRSVIERIGPTEALRVRTEPDSARNPESVRLLSEPDPQTIVLEANLHAPGFVIVADTYYPGWSATVDGVQATIHPANLMFRAVYVPAGRHTIVMKYESTWLRTGGVLTLLGLFLTGVLFVLGRQQSQR